MELILVTVAGMFIGLCAGMWMPGRDLRGTLLVPGISTITMVVMWEALTWMGLKYGDFLIWALTFGITIAVAFGTSLYLNDSRKLSEAALTTKR
jgi:lipopolysaccharide export LptBFGC system permease protein LptF